MKWMPLAIAALFLGACVVKYDSEDGNGQDESHDHSDEHGDQSHDEGGGHDGDAAHPVDHDESAHEHDESAHEHDESAHEHDGGDGDAGHSIRVNVPDLPAATGDRQKDIDALTEALQGLNEQQAANEKAYKDLIAAGSNADPSELRRIELMNRTIKARAGEAQKRLRELRR